ELSTTNRRSTGVVAGSQAYAPPSLPCSPASSEKTTFFAEHPAAHNAPPTTATMMYGHIEADEDIIIHIESIRKLQDETNGFTAFVPWSFKPGNTPLEKIIPHYATSTRYLQILAISRIYLDNFQHIQASWFSEGKKAGQIALHFGADDFGGTLLEENVHAAANFINKTNTEEVIELIREAGFVPAQRTTLYEILKVYEKAEAA
ncbi:MAG: hypothetical protein AABZ61_03630, partial [Bacteroidota bacterium]